MIQQYYSLMCDDLFVRFIDSLCVEDWVRLHNAFCEQTGCYEEKIYRNTRKIFNERLKRLKPWDIAELTLSHYDVDDDFFQYNGDLLESFCITNDWREYTRIPYMLWDMKAPQIMDLFDDLEIDCSDLKRDLQKIEKHLFKETWESTFNDIIPSWTFPNEDCHYINYNEEEDTLETGSVCNGGFCRDSRTVSVKVDYNESLGYYLDQLYEKMIEEHPELAEESCQSL